MCNYYISIVSGVGTVVQYSTYTHIYIYTIVYTIYYNTLIWTLQFRVFVCVFICKRKGRVLQCYASDQYVMQSVATWKFPNQIFYTLFMHPLMCLFMVLQLVLPWKCYLVVAEPYKISFVGLEKNVFFFFKFFYCYYFYSNITRPIRN